MKDFSERNPITIGIVGVAVAASAVLFALNYDNIPGLSGGKTYSAYFADAGALKTGSAVRVSGYRVGEVTDIELEGNRVLITFKIDNGVRLGNRTEAAIETETLLGTKLVRVTSRGEGQLSQPIPIERTTSPYQLPEALGDLSNTIRGLNTDQLNTSLSTLTQAFKDTPPQLRVAVEGLERFSKVLNTRDEQLRNLLTNANKATGVLAKRSNDIASLVRDTNALLAELQTQSGALDQIANSISAVSRQLSGFIAENRDQLRPALDKLNGVLTLVDNRKAEVQTSIKLLNSYAMSLGESVSSGPFFSAYVANLLPGQFVQPFVDAAFSDLGLDPHVLPPSERTEPQTGQPGTPALPVPLPRTGQGGEPKLTLPDAITGKPGDARYPYREPLPAPPPGGPPPGPPAVAPPGLASTSDPTPSPVYQPAPGEVTHGLLPGPSSEPGETSTEEAGQ